MVNGGRWLMASWLCIATNGVWKDGNVHTAKKLLAKKVLVVGYWCFKKGLTCVSSNAALQCRVVYLQASIIMASDGVGIFLKKEINQQGTLYAHCFRYHPPTVINLPPFGCATTNLSDRAIPQIKIWMFHKPWPWRLPLWMHLPCTLQQAPLENGTPNQIPSINQSTWLYQKTSNYCTYIVEEVVFFGVSNPENQAHHGFEQRHGAPPPLRLWSRRSPGIAWSTAVAVELQGVEGVRPLEDHWKCIGCRNLPEEKGWEMMANDGKWMMERYGKWLIKWRIFLED